MINSFRLAGPRHKIRMVILLLGIVFLCYRISLTIVYPNPYFWLILVALPAALILIKSNEFGILLIMFSVFFTDWLSGVGLIPTQLTWLPEIVLIVYVAKILILRKRLIGTPIDIPVLLFVIIAVCSMLINSKSLISALLAFRLDLKFILMFYVLINLNFKEISYKRMISILIFLLAIQVPVAIAKYLKFGQMESSIGTYGYFGGALSTILPLMAISLFLGLYIFKYENFHKKYLILIMGYLIFPILAAKKGFLFFGFLLILFLIWQTKGHYLKRIIRATLVFIPGLLASLYLIPQLRPALENPRYLWEFSVSYETRRFGEGEVGGRLAAVGETYKSMKKDSIRFLMGYGPGSTIQSYFEEYNAIARGQLPIRIIYGFTHLVTTVIDYGYLGFLLYFLLPIVILFRMNQKFYKNIKDAYWKAISFGLGGILFSSLTIGLLYWDLFRIDLAGFVFWFFAAAIFAMGKQNRIL